MALSIFENAFKKERTREDNLGFRHSRRRYDYDKGRYVRSGEAKHDAFIETAAKTLAAVQTVCDALVPAGSGRYSVSFGGRTAATSLEQRRIMITPQPLYTKGLRLADVADTLTGFVVHEIGHVAISGETDVLVQGWLAAEPQVRRWKATIMALANVLDDDALERWAKHRFPGVASAFKVTTKFVAQDQGMPSRPPYRFDPSADYTERFNFMVVSVRYRWFVRWLADAATRRERQWWIDWATRYADPTDAALRLEGIKAGLARLAIKPENRPEDEPQPSDEQGEGEDESDDEPESFDTEDEDEDEDEDKHQGLDQHEDGTALSDPSDDEPEGKPEKAGLTAGQDGEDTTDEDGYEEDDESSDERPDGGQLDMDADDLGQQREGSDTPPIYDGYDEETFTRDKVKTLDDYVEDRKADNSYRDDKLADEVSVEMRTSKVTDTHGFGSMKVKINL